MAGASPAITLCRNRPVGSAAVLLQRGLGRRRLVEPLLELAHDLRQVLRLGARVLRVLPLEARLKMAPYLPIGVAEMVIDDGIAGVQLERLLELAHGGGVVAEAVIGPAERVDDHAV